MLFYHTSQKKSREIVPFLCNLLGKSQNKIAHPIRFLAQACHEIDISQKIESGCAKEGTRRTIAHRRVLLYRKNAIL